MSDPVTCPADGCDYMGMPRSVLGHYSGKRDEAHEGGYADAKRLLNTGSDRDGTDDRPTPDPDADPNDEESIQSGSQGDTQTPADTGESDAESDSGGLGLSGTLDFSTTNGDADPSDADGETDESPASDGSSDGVDAWVLGGALVATAPFVLAGLMQKRDSDSDTTDTDDYDMV